MITQTLFFNLYGHYCDMIFYFGFETCSKLPYESLGNGNYDDFFADFSDIIRWTTNINNLPDPLQRFTTRLVIKDNEEFQPIKQLKDHG